jgi:hypothetical protein
MLVMYFNFKTEFNCFHVLKFEIAFKIYSNFIIVVAKIF